MHNLPAGINVKATEKNIVIVESEKKLEGPPANRSTR